MDPGSRCQAIALFFLDPCLVIGHYTSCQLNQSKSGVLGHGLAEVWCFCNEEDSYDLAHDALGEARLVK